MSSLLESVRQTPRETSKGPCALPILYRDASQLGVFFLADLDRARELLGQTSLEPWPVFGKAIVAIYAWEYRDSTVGTYNEVGLGIQCRRRGTRPSLLRLVRDMGAQEDQGIWVVNLPVTTEAALAAGVELWGYPKYLAPIETRFESAGANVRLGDELEVTVPRLHGPTMLGQPVVTYTGKGGRLIRTAIRTDCRIGWGAGLAARVSVGGDGPTSRSLRALGLDAPRVVAAFRSDGFRAVLPAGEDLGPL
jgi:hypothetical protein